MSNHAHFRRFGSILHQTKWTGVDLIRKNPVVLIWVYSSNAGNPRIDVPFGDGLYHPFRVKLGMVYEIGFTRLLLL